MHSNFPLQSPISKDDVQQLLLKINHKLCYVHIIKHLGVVLVSSYITLFLLAKESEKITDESKINFALLALLLFGWVTKQLANIIQA
ncbi:hypothetical protein L1887_10996 [Cichorium endivia]|nr:hypothetical protein L1887_10996 [Cichorium endivia]